MLMLAVEGEPYVSRTAPVQSITLFANGRRVSAWWLRARAPTVLRAAIDPDLFLVRRSRALLNLTFGLPNAVAPYDAGDGPDERQLAFCFRTICLRAAEPCCGR